MFFQECLSEKIDARTTIKTFVGGAKKNNVGGKES